MPDEPEALGLLSLMLLHDARRAARTDGAELITLEDQDRARWDASEIEEGLAHLDAALRHDRAGPYQLQAAIAACHATAADAADTDWKQIALLYERLAKVVPSAVVGLNRAVAVAMADGPAAGLELVDALEDSGALAGYHLLPATRADLLRRLGRDAEAAAAYRRAAERARALFANAEALEHLRAALAVGDPEPTSLHAAIGDLQTLQGEYDAALASYETAAAHATPDGVGEIEHRLGQVRHRRGEWALATAHFEAALAAEAEPARRARILADLSLSAHDGGDPARAAELAERARALAEEAGDPRALGQAHNLLGALATSGGAAADALEHLGRSLELAAATGDPGARVAALNNLALAHRARGELEPALELTRAALALCAAQGDRHREAALHNNLADLLHDAGRHEDAMEELKCAVAIFAEVGAEGEPQPEVWKLARW